MSNKINMTSELRLPKCTENTATILTEFFNFFETNFFSNARIGKKIYNDAKSLLVFFRILVTNNL